MIKIPAGVATKTSTLTIHEPGPSKRELTVRKTHINRLKSLNMIAIFDTEKRLAWLIPLSQVHLNVVWRSE